jgi:hypothetical protein
MAEITADDISTYLSTRDDFDLELFAYRTLRECGFVAHHGGRYIDPVAGKPRQYDVRARFEFRHRRDLLLAVECKSLTPEFRLVVSRVPRPTDDSYHDIVKRWHRPEQNDTAFKVARSVPNHPKLYPEGEMVGKSATQIRWNEPSKKWISSDAESYDKWSQSLASAAELLNMSATQTAPAGEPTVTFVMPVLLINDGTLWVVDYSEAGARGAPVPADEALLFVDCDYEVKGRYSTEKYGLSHLHIYTRTGFLSLLKQYLNNGWILEKTFGFSLRET